MLKLCSALILCLLLSNLIVGITVKPNDNVKHKQTESTAAVSADQLSKEDVPIAMEGQSKFFASSPKFNWKETVKKGKKTVSKKLDEKLYQNDTHNNSSTEKLKMDKVTTNINIIPKNETIKNKISNISSTTEKSKAIYVAPVREESTIPNVTQSTTTTTTSTRKPKSKPIYTEGLKDAPDGPIPAPPTGRSPLNVPRKIDYIVPVVITITALPLLGIAFYALYKRGKDYWSKRHYRRMDFLIDGMYNE